MPVALLLCKVTVLLAAAWVAARVFRSESADLRHRVWTLALAASLILPLLGAALPGWRPAAVGRAFAQVTGSLARAPVGRALPPMAVNAVPARVTPADVILFIWVAGCSIMLMRFVRGLVALAWLSSRAKPILEDRWMWAVLNTSRQLGITRAVRLLESRQPQSMPLTWGFLRPAILLPSDAHTWDDERRDLVLAHELSHVARADWPVQIVAE
ncbi:MAG: peptidase BlaR1, partial [Bryobacterales bacterium]|nr:peptidase BlaR1 [Bryobacterales bacterium]